MEIPNDVCLTPEEVAKYQLQAEWKRTGWGVLLPVGQGGVLLPLPQDEALSQFMADPDEAILLARSQVAYFSHKGWAKFQAEEAQS